MRRHVEVAFALFATYLVLSVAPAAAASTTSSVVTHDYHTTDSELGSGTLTHAKVSGSGTSASVVATSREKATADTGSELSAGTTSKTVVSSGKVKLDRDTSARFKDDFSTLNTSRWTIENDAWYDSSNDYVQLTNQTDDQSGAVQYDNSLDPTRFTVTFDQYIYDSGDADSGADGIYFNWGGSSVNSGYYVHFDNYGNSDDSAEFTISIFNESSDKELKQVTVSNGFEDGKWRNTKVIVNSGQVTVWFNGTKYIDSYQITDYKPNGSSMQIRGRTGGANAVHRADNVEVYPRNYYDSGRYTSKWYNFDGSVPWGKFSKLQSLNGQSISYQFRSSSDGTSSTASSWYSSIDKVPDGQYIQARAVFETTKPDTTPTLDSFMLRPNESATAWYTGANYSVADTREIWANLTLSDTSALIQARYYNTSSGAWETYASKTVSSTGNYSVAFTSDKWDTWRVRVKMDPTTSSYTAKLHDEGIQYRNEKPTADEGTASPQGGKKLDQREVELSIQVNDSDFAEPPDETLTVKWYIDGSKRKTTTVNSNGTASTTVTISEGGSHTWQAVIVDSAGHSYTTDADSSTSGDQSFEFSVPSKLYIYNESAPQQKVKNVKVKIRFYGASSDYVVEKTTPDGSINMSGVPVDEPFVVIAQADNYHNRRVYVPSLYETQRIYLLNNSKKAVYNVFKLKDKSGKYSPSSTRVIIKRALNKTGDGLVWVTISGDYFGATNRHPTHLRYNKRYRIYVANDAGNRRLIGAYMATDEQNPKYLVIRQIVVDPPEGKNYYGTGWLDAGKKGDSEETIWFTYKDEANATSELKVKIYQQGNKSNVLAKTTVDPDESFAWSPKLTGEETRKTWVVNWTATRNGKTVGEAFPVGNGGSVPLPIDPTWLNRFMLIFIPVVGALSSERIATFGTLGLVALVGVLMVAGWYDVQPVLWLAALVVSLGGHAFATASNRGAFG